MNRLVGVKNYGFEWTTIHGLDEEAAADRLVAHGVDWVVVQNLIDPLPASAVTQAPPPTSYEDRRFREALHKRGLRVFEATAVFFQPKLYAARPDLRPVDARGQTMEPFGWYVGLCPSSPACLAERAALVEEVVATLASDGVFLSFIRFPAFWELWMPETRREEISEYCFCERCTSRFQAETGQWLPDGPVSLRASLLQSELRGAWTRWKCELIADAVATFRAAAQRARPGTELMVNGFGFGRDDFGNAVEEVLGQDVEILSRHADHFDLMFYQQILRREPAPWITRVTSEVRGHTERTLLGCVQAKAGYLDLLYAAGRRAPAVPPQEFEGALRAIAESPADGVLVYSWKDVLEDEAAGGRMVRALRAFKET